MRFTKGIYAIMASMTFFFVTSLPALAAGGGAAPIVLVADTRKLDGLFYWWASLYNESHLQFTLLTVLLIPTVGVIFGLLADVIMGWIGIDLTKRELAEH